ncbi:GDSL lipase/esterase [Dillenia turbinata]|uniref:GDSL lipase/esterase n=1 Tax=Dillenia turbinata TaxID=194707 RepID=A0AAN8YW30_9MAGN
MKRLSIPFTILVIFSSTLVSPISCTTNNGVALFVFGDSLFDPGNNNYINGSMQGPSNSWPYGESYLKQPTGGLSDGRLVPDFIAEFMNLPIWTPYLKPVEHQFTYGANFASAGAGVLPQTRPGTIDLWTQLSYFKKVEETLRQKLGATESKKFLGRAIYLISMGGNDYFGNTWVGRTKIRVSERRGIRLCTEHASKIECCVDGASSLGRLHNRRLSEVLGKLQTTLAGFKYTNFDYYNSIFERVNNPSKHGFKEGKSACCGSGAYRAGFNCGQGTQGKDYELCSNPQEYIWFDAGHTTESANLQLATLLWNGTSSVMAPHNLKQFYEQL